MTPTVVGKIEHDGEWLVVFDDSVSPLHVDLVTEIAEEDGIVRVSFAAVTKDGDGVAKADIVARLRMKTDTAWELCKSLNALEGNH